MVGKKLCYCIHGFLLFCNIRDRRPWGENSRTFQRKKCFWSLLPWPMSQMDKLDTLGDLKGAPILKHFVDLESPAFCD